MNKIAKCLGLPRNLRNLPIIQLLALTETESFHPLRPSSTTKSTIKATLKASQSCWPHTAVPGWSHLSLNQPKSQIQRCCWQSPWWKQSLGELQEAAIDYVALGGICRRFLGGSSLKAGWKAYFSKRIVLLTGISQYNRLHSEEIVVSCAPVSSPALEECSSAGRELCQRECVAAML